jgi:hypothetical protein
MNMRVEDRLQEFESLQLSKLNTRIGEIVRSLDDPEDCCLMLLLTDCMGQICHELLCRLVPREHAHRIWRESTTN